VRTPADGSDTEVEYIYDGLGRLSDVIVHRRNGLLVTEQFSYGYNDVQSIDWACLPNGGCVDYTYDNIGRLTFVENKDSLDTVLSSFAYGVYADGQRAWSTETDELGIVTDIDWGYDNINRVVSEDFVVDGVPGDNYSHVYDMVGNRVSKTVNANATTFSYNSKDQLTQEVSTTETIDYYYDLNGSLIQKSVVGGDVTDYAYNLQNRLSEVRLNNIFVADYLYNPDGICVERYDGTDTTAYLIDPANHTGYPQTLKESDSSNSRVYIIGSDVLGQADGSSGMKSFLYDGHGSVRQLANDNGTVAESYGYDAYGNDIGFNAATAGTSLLYTGETYDPSVGMYYLDARYYDPATARLNRPDPFSGNIFDPQSLHDYAYCHGNPVNGIDPSGRLFSNLLYGRIVHTKIGVDFRESGIDAISDRSIKYILGVELSWWGLNRPDLVERATGEVYEIKPTGSYLAGAAQLGWYIALLNTNDPLGRTWIPGVSYMPPSMVDIDPLTFAIVSPPISGVILYEVVDLKPAVAMVTAYAAYRVSQSVSTAIMLNSLAPAF
jgi:RHS repeat-associated protein